MEDILSNILVSNTTKCVNEFTSTDAVISNTSIDFLFHGLGMLFLLIVGITANVLSVIVLNHPKLKTSLNTLLLGLTISDIFVISTSFLVFSLSPILEQIHVFRWYIAVFRPFLLPWLLPIALTAQMSSVYFTVVITLERYIAVCLPLQARSLCTRSSAKSSTLAIIIFSTMYNIPRWFEFQTIPNKISCTGQILSYTEKETIFRTNQLYVTLYINWSYLVFMYLVPFTILVCFNLTVYRQARLHRTHRNSLCPGLARTVKSSMTVEDIQLASMLFGIVITFIACNMLTLVINVMENFGIAWNWIGTLIPISNFLVVLGCSTNFIFYCVFGTEFRRRLNTKLRMRRRSEQWSEKDFHTGRQRLESLQNPNLDGDVRGRSNSDDSTTGNNNCCKGGTNDNCREREEHEFNRSTSIDVMRRGSQITNISIISDEML